MLKRVNWKYVFKCFAWVVCLGGIVTLMSFVEVKKHTVLCTNIKILIPGADNFIEREEIDAILKQSQGQLIGRNLEGINLNAIEEKIKSNPYIAMSSVYADMDGVIHIEISQRQPLLRVINAGGQDYYIDRHGLKMPISPNFTANVLVANGHILEHFSGKVDTLITKMAADLYKTALFLKKDTLWDAQIEQIFVNGKDDIELVPRVGNQRIILGSADSLETKMTNLLTFYKKAMPQVGWDTYKTINIKYSNQIVCEKNNPDSVNGVYRPQPFRPTPATAKKVMDSIIKAEIASELKNNPDENSVMTTQPERTAAPPIARVIPDPVIRKTEVKKVDVKKVEPKKAEVRKPEARKTDVKKTEVKKTEVKAVIVKKPDDKKAWVKKPEVKNADAKTTLKPIVKKEVAAPEKAKIPAAKKPEAKAATTSDAPAKKVRTGAMPEIKWIKPVPKTAKPIEDKNTKKNK